MKNITSIYHINNVSGLHFDNSVSYEVWYTLVLLLLTVLSLVVCITSTLKIVRVSSGFSLLDPEATSGMRTKKWVMCAIVIANGIQFVTSLIEVFLFLLSIINNESDGEGSPLMFYYFTNENIASKGTADMFLNTNANILFCCRVISNDAFFLLSCFLLWYYISTWQSLIGSDSTFVKRIQYFIIAFYFISFLMTLMFSSIYPNITKIVTIYFNMSLIATIISSYYIFVILQWLRSTGSSNQKIYNRFMLISIVGLLPLVINTCYFSFQLWMSSFFDRFFNIMIKYNN